MARLGLVAAPLRARRAYVGPVMLLLAVTLAAVLLHGKHQGSTPKPSPHRHTTSQPAPKRLYTVAAGDTVAGIAAKTGIPLALIETLNPSLRPTALFIGEKIRLR